MASVWKGLSFLCCALSLLFAFQQNNGDLACDLRGKLSKSGYLLYLDVPESFPLRAIDNDGSGLELLRAKLDNHIRVCDQVVIPGGIGLRAPIAGENVDVTTLGQVYQWAGARLAAFCSRCRQQK